MPPLARIFVVMLWTLVGGCSTRTTLLVPTATGEIQLRFDPFRISEDYLRDLVKISPYRPENLIVVDVVSGQQFLDFVDAMKPPQELAAAAIYVRGQVSFDLCLHRAELEYYRGNDEALETRCDDIDPNITCSHWVSEAPSKRIARCAQVFGWLQLAQLYERRVSGALRNVSTGELAALFKCFWY